MKIIIASLIACVSVGAHAQAYSPSPILPNAGIEETPSMKQAKLVRAIALRAEAADLLKQDGGALTAAHQAYIRRKACNILGGKSPNMGSLIASNTCGA